VVHHPSRRGFDPRPLRFEQGVVALVLLIGFTFQAELLIPVVTVVLALSGAVGPRRAPLPRLFSAVVGDRLEPPDAFVDRQTVRLSVLVQTGALVVASLLVFVGLGVLAWIVALAVVATTAFDAATGSWIEAGLYWRLARRRRP
jgi:cytochrome c biogenesis protein CcdA